jgi:hypothetical protein
VKKLKQTESVYKSQIEVLTSSMALLPHPDDMKQVEDQLRLEMEELKQGNKSLIMVNMSMKAEISQVDLLSSLLCLPFSCSYVLITRHLEMRGSCIRVGVCSSFIVFRLKS